MKKIGITILMLALMLGSGVIFGQKLKSGDLKILKGQSTINLQYDYSAMAVGKFSTEAEYLKKGTDERNAKEAGTGDAWAAKWNSGKTEKYQPAFEEIGRAHV